MIEFRVIGESRDDPGHLLVLDEDGHAYDYDLFFDVIEPVELDERWMIDRFQGTAMVITAPVERIAS